MPGRTSKTMVIFARPFTIPGFDETLPAGEYDLEMEIASQSNHLITDRWKALVQVRLHPRQSHPGLVRTLTVPLAVLDQALARDKLTGSRIVDSFVEEMLADPMVRLVMRADRVSEVEVRDIYSRVRWAERSESDSDRVGNNDHGAQCAQERTAVQVAENEGMPVLPV